MWFQFPPGAESITVQRQNFGVEIKDAQGIGYFRAPSHFAPTILAIPGFGLARDLPDDAPVDNTGTGKEEKAMSSLAASLEAKDMEIQGLREDLNAAMAENASLKEKNAQLLADNDKLQDLMDNIEQQLEDKGQAVPAALKAKTGGSKAAS